MAKKNESTSNITEKESLLFYMVSFLKNNVYNIDALKTLPDDVGYSYSYISRSFKKLTGVSFNSYVNHYRISKACYLLIAPLFLKHNLTCLHISMHEVR